MQPASSDQALQSGRQLVDTPPAALTRLVRMVARAFYTGEQAVIIDYLCKRTIVKEEDMAQLFRLDLKQLRQLLVALKQDQLIRSKKRMETSADGRVSKVDYFYINYEVFINVVKYKLDTMQHRLEREQREFTARAAFHCTACGKTFTDLQVNELMDFGTGELKCSFCTTEVVEEENVATRQDLRMNMARFHEQVRDPLDALLKEIESFRLGPSLLEPALTELAPLGASGDRPDFAGSASSASLLGGGGGLTRGSSANITVDMSAGGEGEAGKSSIKEVPQWMLGTIALEEEDSNSRFSLDGGVGGSAGGAGGLDSARKVEIQDLLLQNEVRQKKLQEQQQQKLLQQQQQQQKKKTNKRSSIKKKSAAAAESSEDEDEDNGANPSSTSSTGSDSDAPAGAVDDAASASAGPSAAKRFRADDSDGDAEDDADEDDSESDDEDDDDLTVTFQGRRMPYDEVTEDMVKAMTPEEKAAYAAVGQKYYAMFDE